MKKRLGLKVLAISIILTIVASGIVFGASPKSSEKVQDETIIFDTGKGGYRLSFMQKRDTLVGEESV